MSINLANQVIYVLVTMVTTGVLQLYGGPADDVIHGCHGDAQQLEQQ